MSDKKFEKLVAVEALNLFTGANERLAERAKEYVFYDDVPSSEEEVIRRAKDADGILVNLSTQITANIIEHCPKLRYIGMCCSLYDESSASVDIRCAREHGITVYGVSDYGDNGVGEYVVSQLICLLNGFNGKRWGDHPLELTGVPVGIIGMGKISRLVVKKLSGFEMNILATDPYVKQADVEGLGITMATPEELYAKSDFVIVHTSLFPSTFHLVGAEQFKAMKNTAFIINAARGAVIDEAAMIEALKSGEIAGAGLDVFEQEPPADDNPLFSMENVIVSPHNAALSDGALRAMAMDSAQGITEYLTGKPVTYPVNKEVLK